MIDPKLKQFASPTQLKYIEAIDKCGSNAKAAKYLGVNNRSLERAMARLKLAAAKRNYAPEFGYEKVIPPGFQTAFVTQKTGPNGELLHQYVRSEPDDTARLEAIQEAIEALAKDAPRLAPIEFEGFTSDLLCNVYTLTDCHVGMMAHNREKWTLAKAEEILTKCFSAMMASSPDAETCYIAQLGDFLHFDGLSPVTPKSGHVLPSVCDHKDMIRMAWSIMRSVIDMALHKHKNVVVLVAEGNHDESGSEWLHLLVSTVYENEPRVRVIDNSSPYYAERHGNTMLCWHHSHLSKMSNLPSIMSVQFAKIWGNTTKRFCHTGHKHHTKVIGENEDGGMVVRQHPTLAAADDYTIRHGWSALRRVTAITYHKKYGEVFTNTICPEMVS